MSIVYVLVATRLCRKREDELLSQVVPLKYLSTSPLRLTVFWLNTFIHPSGTRGILSLIVSCLQHSVTSCRSIASVAKVQDFIKWIQVLLEECLSHNLIELVKIDNKISASNESDLTFK